MKKLLKSVYPEIFGAIGGVTLLAYGYLVFGFSDLVVKSNQAKELAERCSSIGLGWSHVMTSIIALLAAFIAYQQWNTARNKLKFDLYDKRFSVYQATRLALAKIAYGGKMDMEKEHEYLNAISGARWLFDEQLFFYLNNEVWEKIVDIFTLESELEGVPVQDQDANKFRERADIKKYLMRQVGELDIRFHKFLALRH